MNLSLHKVAAVCILGRSKGRLIYGVLGLDFANFWSYKVIFEGSETECLKVFMKYKGKSNV